MTILKLDKPGEYDVGKMLDVGLVPVQNQVIEVTAPDVTIHNLEGTGMRRAAGDNQGDSSWQAFVRVRAAAARCTIANSKLDDNDVISVHVAAPDFTLDSCAITRMGAGVFVEGSAAKTSRIINSAIHKADRMLRQTVSPTTDDCGAIGVAYKDTPRNTVRHKLLGSYIGECVAWSEDYDWGEGAAVEIYQTSSVEVNGCVLLDNSVATETGSKSPIQVSDIHFINNWIGALELIADEKFRRGLGLRPLADSRITGNKFFDLDHWDCVYGWGSQTFGFGTNQNLVFSGNQHATTRNSKAYTYGGNGGTSGVTLDTAETILFGSAAQPMAAQFRGESITRRDMILAGAGLIMVKPPEPPSQELEALTARVAALEAALKAEEGARMTADALEQQARVAADAALDKRLDNISSGSAG